MREMDIEEKSKLRGIKMQNIEIQNKKQKE
jgi:hypothetical protein